MFKTYAHALSWIDTESEKYGSKQAFYASDEYKERYAEIQQVYEEDKVDWTARAEQAMKSVHANYGDNVEYPVESSWGHVDILRGTIVKREGMPKVKLDVKFNNRRYVKWHTGWMKYNGGVN